jgi:hypothetical protein
MAESFWRGASMAVGGGPTPEQWVKMSKTEKSVYWIFIALVFAAIGYGIFLESFP